MTRPSLRSTLARRPRHDPLDLQGWDDRDPEPEGRTVGSRAILAVGAVALLIGVVVLLVMGPQS